MDKIEDAKQRLDAMELMTSWERRGRKEGRKEGRREGEVTTIKRLLKRRVGPLDATLAKEIERLSASRREALTEALFDFGTVEDLRRWLTQERG